MKYGLITFVFVATILGVALAPVLAQTMPPGSSTPPGAYNSPSPSASPMPSAPQEKQVQGEVKKVDPAAKTVEVKRLLGLLSTKLDVTDDTNITIQGNKGSLQDLQEGAKVKASYEARDGKNIAKSIEVMPAERGTAAKASQ
jgi:Cu/Ag efflux protein CusF